MQQIKPFFTHKNLVRFLVVLIVSLALTAGYYHAQLEAEQRKYLQLEDKYVRVRSQLGREETQRLIDKSYE
jgi:hypothetical protein